MLFAAPAAASAAVFVVNTTADGSDGECSVDCTLREAVGLATPPTDSVSVPAGTYVLSGELLLLGDTINGAGARATIIDGGGLSRVLRTQTGNDIEPSISGVTIRGGNGQGQVDPGDGGGILVEFGDLSIGNSHVYGNTAAQGGGIHLASGARLFMVASTVAGNVASTSTDSDGGGIYSANEGIIAAANSTITGNIARDTGPNSAQGGGIYAGTGTAVFLSSVTLAGNEASANNGGGVWLAGGPTNQLTNTIVAENAGGACGGGGVADITATSHHNLATDGSCALTGPGNLQGVGALIGGLTNHGGPTDTRALAATSPAVNAGSGCATTDQRGITRPQGAACDIGAFEYVAPVLTLTTTVVNNDGGEDGPGDVTVAVRDGAGTAVGGPQPSSAAGSAFTLAPGSFRVSANGANQYAITIGGACAADGTVAIGENQALTCTITANDKQPRAGREVAATPARGTVRIKKPGGRFRIMREGDLLPNGTIVDTLKGRITLIAPANRSGRETKADFYKGIFKIKQSKGRRPTTTLTLNEKLACPKPGKASSAQKRKKKRRLWGDGRGRFRTKGKHSAATVVGTKWLVEDRCKSTLTRVARGKVSVRDFVKKKTVTVRKGKRYIARAKR
jgi:CSLREA domain-containing protein